MIRQALHLPSVATDVAGHRNRPTPRHSVLYRRKEFQISSKHGTNNGTGVGLVEVYNLGAASMDVSSEAHLANPVLEVPKPDGSVVTNDDW